MVVALEQDPNGCVVAGHNDPRQRVVGLGRLKQLRAVSLDLSTRLMSVVSSRSGCMYLMQEPNVVHAPHERAFIDYPVRFLEFWTFDDHRPEPAAAGCFLHCSNLERLGFCVSREVHDVESLFD